MDDHLNSGGTAPLPPALAAMLAAAERKELDARIAALALEQAETASNWSRLAEVARLELAGMGFLEGLDGAVFQALEEEKAPSTFNGHTDRILFRVQFQGIADICVHFSRDEEGIWSFNYADTQFSSSRHGRTEVAALLLQARKEYRGG